MKTLRNKFIKTSSLLVLSCLVSQHQQAVFADDNSFEFEEIIVTGNKRLKSLQDTQTSVAVLRGDALDEQVVIDIEEALLRISNADVATTGNLSIRGIQKQGPTGGITTNRMVLGYYVDGVALSAQAQRFALSNWDIDQIEVLRGPVTTVQGRNALAGGLIVSTGKPEHEWGGKVRASYGTQNTYQLAAALTGPLIDDVLAFRVSVDHNKSDGFITNITRDEDDYGGSDSTTIRAKLQFDPVSIPDFSATAAFTHINMDRSGGAISSIGPNFDDRISIAGAPVVSETDGISLYSLTLGYDLSEQWSLKSVTAYQESDVLNELPFIEVNPGNPDHTAFGRFDDTLFSQEFLLTYTGDRLNGLVGLYYADVENYQERGATFNAGLVDPMLLGLNVSNVSPLREEISNYAGFIDFSYQVNDWLELIGGVRFDNEKNVFTRSSSGLEVSAISLALLPPVPDITTERSSGTEVLSKIGAVASLSESASVGFTYSEGYRPGGSGINLAEVVRSGVPALFEYDSEHTSNYELSFRSQWFDKALTLNANAYLIDWSNQQVNLVGPLGSAFDDEVIANAATSTVKGVEVEIMGNVGELDLYTSFAISDTEFGQFDANGRDFSGHEFARSPNFSGAAGFSYKFDSGLFISGNVNHIGSSFQNNSNTINLKSYTLVNVSTAYEWNNIRLFAFVKNLFDANAFTQIGFEGPFEVLSIGGPFELRSRRKPRYIGAGIELSF